MARWSEGELCRRAAEAENARTEIMPWYDAAIDLSMPWRKRRGGREAFERIFDSTGLDSTQKGASRLQRDFTPPFQRWFKLACGPMVPMQLQEGINAKLEMATSIVHAALDASAFPQASQQVYADLFLGTGALLAVEGDDRDPIRWTAAAPWQLGIEEGASGRIDNVYWHKEYPAWLLPQHWPKAVWPKALAELISERSTRRIRVLQASYYDPDEGTWRIAIVVRGGADMGGDGCVWEDTSRTNPWIIPRWWTTPESPWGRGPLLTKTPSIRTLNKAMEMILSAASYRLAPPLMVLHDGVVNPDTMRLAPRSLIKVARTGGPMGRSIEPLDVGSNVDLAQIILQDEREGINKGLLNEDLPPLSGAVRSAAEIIERAKRLQYDGGAAFGRLNHEFAPPVIARVIDILDRKKVAGIDWRELAVDHFTLKVEVISPLARSQALDDVQTTVQWLETMKAIGGDEMVAHAAKIEDVGAGLGHDMGVRNAYIRPKAERDALEQAGGQAAADAANGGPPASGPGAAGPGGPPSLQGSADPAAFPTAPAQLALPAPGA